MTGKIFLNYRRSDASHASGRLHDRLDAAFGAENVVFDVQTIPLGVDFVAYLDAQVRACDVLVAMIGPGWAEELAARQASGEPDFVVIELEAALGRGIPVIPVLLDGARMPVAAALPEEIQSLARRNAARLSHEGFRGEAERLIEGIRALLDGPAVPAAPAARRVAPPSPPEPEAERWAPLSVFRDGLTSGGEGPEMVAIPAGAFLMGSPEDEPERRVYEGPQHEVTFARPFALGRYAVTFEEYDRSCAASGRAQPGDYGWGRGRRPVINVSWEDARAYCAWLSAETGADYRLPSEAEWEYACRAGATTPFSWGAAISPDQANYDGNYAYHGGPSGVDRQRTEPVDAFGPNPWGLYQMHGNVWEWCADAWNATYEGAPTDRRAWMQGDASRAVLRGGSWGNEPWNLRSASRFRYLRHYRFISIGFRVARTLNP